MPEPQDRLGSNSKQDLQSFEQEVLFHSTTVEESQKGVPESGSFPTEQGQGHKLRVILIFTIYLSQQAFLRRVPTLIDSIHFPKEKIQNMSHEKLCQVTEMINLSEEGTDVDTTRTK